MIVQVDSVRLGRGKPVFPRRVLSPMLRLVSVYRMGSGMADSCYEIDRSGAAGAG